MQSGTPRGNLLRFWADKIIATKTLDNKTVSLLLDALEKAGETLPFAAGARRMVEIIRGMENNGGAKIVLIKAKPSHGPYYYLIAVLDENTNSVRLIMPLEKPLYFIARYDPDLAARVLADIAGDEQTLQDIINYLSTRRYPAFGIPDAVLEKLVEKTKRTPMAA